MKIRKLADTIRTGWQGSAGAYGVAVPVAQNALRGVAQLYRSQDLLSRQSGSFRRAANNVRPTPPRPPENPLSGLLPFETNHDRQVRASGGYPGSGVAPPGGSSVRGPLPGGGGTTSPNEWRPTPSPMSGLVPQAPAARASAGDGAPGELVGGVSGGSGSGGARGSGLVAGGGNGPGAGAHAFGPGVGAGPLAADESAARRGAPVGVRGGGGGPSPLGGAPMGGGRGRDDEELEHSRKVLTEADGEDVFGSDVLTAPQVIGDDGFED